MVMPPPVQLPVSGTHWRREPPEIDAIGCAEQVAPVAQVAGAALRVGDAGAAVGNRLAAARGDHERERAGLGGVIARAGGIVVVLGDDHVVQRRRAA